jgi:hypothetical protein
MMAARRKVLDREPSEIEMLLPFHAAGTLSARDARLMMTGDDKRVNLW